MAFTPSACSSRFLTDRSVAALMLEPLRRRDPRLRSRSDPRWVEPSGLAVDPSGSCSSRPARPRPNDRGDRSPAAPPRSGPKRSDRRRPWSTRGANERSLSRVVPGGLDVTFEAVGDDDAPDRDAPARPASRVVLVGDTGRRSHVLSCHARPAQAVSASYFATDEPDVSEGGRARPVGSDRCHVASDAAVPLWPSRPRRSSPPAARRPEGRGRRR